MTPNEISGTIVDSAFKVHKLLGPGLLESAYRACLARELQLRGLHVEREVPLPVYYEGEKLTSATASTCSSTTPSSWN